MDRHAYVIVGAGLAGAATAWHLRQRGVTDVVILEREAVPGAHSSGRNAAIVREQMDEEALQLLSTESVAFLRLGVLAEYRETGGLMIGHGDEDVSIHVPVAVGRAGFRPHDGIVDVAALLASYLEGADVRYRTTITSFCPIENGLRLETNRGPLEAGVLVNAAGAWAGELGDLPLTPTNRHLFVSEADPRIDPDWPYVWDLDHGYYFRPESGGLLLSPCDETASAPGEPPVDPDRLEQLARTLARHQPALADLSIKTGWVGQRTFAPDRLPVIGFDPRERRLFHVAGLGGHGVTLSFSVGALAARLLMGDEPPNDLAPDRLVASTGARGPDT